MREREGKGAFVTVIEHEHYGTFYLKKSNEGTLEKRDSSYCKKENKMQIVSSAIMKVVSSIESF